MADKIMEKEEGSVSGEGLKFGGEWANNLYDRQVKSIVEKLTGEKVKNLDLGLATKEADKFYIPSPPPKLSWHEEPSGDLIATHGNKKVTITRDGENSFSLDSYTVGSGHFGRSFGTLEQAKKFASEHVVSTRVADMAPLSKDSLRLYKVGKDIVTDGQARFVISEILGDGKFAAVPKRRSNTSLK